MFDFIKEFIKEPKFIGAIAPSGKELSNKMIEDIDFKSCDCIVEYGPGTGVFTEKIMARKREDTVFLVFETNYEFYKSLNDTYGHKKNVKIINDSAENIKFYLEELNIESIDYIVSGLPFTSLPKEVSKAILKASIEVLKDKGYLITFQYSLAKKKFFNEYFNDMRIKRSLINLPPAYVLTFQGNQSRVCSKV